MLGAIESDNEQEQRKSKEKEEPGCWQEEVLFQVS